MRFIFALCLLVCATRALSAQAGASPPLPACGDDTSVFVPSDDVLPEHRQFTVPVIAYPFDTRLGETWGVSVQVKVDATGHVQCIGALKVGWGEDMVLNPQRQAMLDGVRDWHYAPFKVNGRAVPAFVTEVIAEEESNARHQPMPHAASNNILISLERSSCLGTCPNYRVEVYGDGRLVYVGTDHVAVRGRHSYRVAPGAVDQLLGTMREGDIWSMRPSYAGSITDVPVYRLTMNLGGTVHRVIDYAGPMVGMPAAVRRVESAVDLAANTQLWLHLSGATIRQLKAEHFRFRSPAGYAIIEHAIVDGSLRDENAILELLNLLMPIDGRHHASASYRAPAFSLLKLALQNNVEVLLDPLIARGALITRAGVGQGKLDAAFGAAMDGASLTQLEHLWTLASPPRQACPSFVSSAKDLPAQRKRVPLTLWPMQKTWPAMQAQYAAMLTWLIDHGCDIKASTADGDTLLHRAASFGHSDLVRYLLAHGLNPSQRGAGGGLPIGDAGNEVVALMLLEAGSDLAPAELAQVRAHAIDLAWPRVAEWLDAHPR
ncbi:MAG: ankyrin repeat domain-containing protein [Pseudomonadota bacterium]